jgi:malonate-semialdehyde dehydrogenase (acetylating) / methylmalonate-semialdehyde dehydrogenase
VFTDVPGRDVLQLPILLIVADTKVVLVKDALVEAAKRKTTGFGLDEGIEMGPVITPESKERIEKFIAKGV